MDSLGYYNPLPGLNDPAEQRKQAIIQHFQSQIMGAPPQNAAQGIGAVLGGIGLTMANRNASFPSAPGGQQPSLGTRLGNFFSFGHNGGLY